MYQLKYRIQALGPLVLSARHGDGNMIETLKFIPGRTVLGMLASRFIRKNNIKPSDACKNEKFHDFFLKGHISFHNAYICRKDDRGDFHGFFPAPLSLHKKKRDNDHKLYDLLICEDMPETQTKFIEGFCRIEEDTVSIADVETSLNFHHMRDPETGMSAEGIIFNYQSIAKDQIFQGEIIGSKEDLQHLKDICQTGWTGYAGRSRNAQYGRVRFEFDQDGPVPVAVSPPGAENSITLLSPAIFYNENGFASTDKSVVETYIGAKIEKMFAAPEEMETFVGVWRLKRPSEACFRAGTCFLLKPLSGDIKNKIAEMQKTGIGERVNEGFGQFCYGLQQAEELTLRSPREELFEKPDSSVPQTVKNLIKTLARESIRKQIIINAMEDERGFEPESANTGKLPSSSLIARLRQMAANLDHQKFVKAVESLNKSALDQLNACRNRKMTLKTFLTEKNVSLKDVFKTTTGSKIKKLCGETGCNPAGKEGWFEKELHHLYFTTFFSVMRKSQKTGRAQ